MLPYRFDRILLALILLCLKLAQERPSLEVADVADAVRRLDRIADDPFAPLLPKGREVGGSGCSQGLAAPSIHRVANPGN